MKKIMILGGGQYSKQVFHTLADAGFVTICVDRDPQAPCGALADVFYPVDIMDLEGVCAIARSTHTDGIMAINDFGTRTASYVAGELSLAGLPIETVDAANDKGRMRDVWSKQGLAQPQYRVFKTLEELKEMTEQIGFPCVVKPTESGGGGRGVSVLRSPDDIAWAYQFAQPYVRNGRFIVEEYVEGIEMTIESFSNGGEVTILAMSDKAKPDLRTRVATSLNYPAAFSRVILKQVRNLVIAAVKAIGVQIGMAHTEVIVASDGPKLVELGARGGGGHIFHTIIEAVSGFNAPVQTARILTGMQVTIPELTDNGAVYRFFTPSRGILKGVRNLEAAALLEGILDIGLTKNIGDLVGDFENSLQRTGFVVTKGQTREAAIVVADRAESMVEFIVDPC
ncbi:Phosphoribosylglycinamide formyltransferase 2 [Methanosarcina siciliae C2J]|uniref:Phosphoribosylglycinamide formyltransferase 2 n=1 Tax=Methanosarcina siciliae C2J TaxID=1434118 RepID=A0A0E3PJJ0_9EURY|nr:ATP-grasp domain-containing protein [Methanosarcina siciliae]AKB35137.1 Phosphoribosylglycinamide formyltransferase 2 [Methanosarcina siciliae C2J]